LAEVDRDPQGAGQVMSDERVLPVYPPVRLLWAAAVADVVGVALAVVGGFRANVAGYGLSALVAIGFLAAFPRVDAVRRRSHDYVPRRELRNIAAALALATLAVAVVHASAIAADLAR
jgi:drug/metabolite transporter (DMT)-like permease